MKKVILFGASGNLGKEIAKELVAKQYDLCVAVRSEDKGKSLSAICQNYIVCNPCDKSSLEGKLKGFDIVVSSLGKSVSPNDKSKASFREVDFQGNSNILEAAFKENIEKFVYISAFHSEQYQKLEYFKVHYDIENLLKSSGIDFSIIKPPAIFSGFADMMQMAKEGKLINIGKGDKKTNPIYEGDLAKITVDSISKTNSVVEAGGKNVYSRKQLNDIVQQEINSNKKIKNIPTFLFRVGLPLMSVFDKNSYHKFSFFFEVIQKDTIAPQVGELSFEEYVKMKSVEYKK